jgi:2-polyprenyl-3-methyl-5-hydroxy-6-metoxy-1,4-benzoquinol methylase
MYSRQYPVSNEKRKEYRSCEICGSNSFEQLHRQKFFISGEDQPFQYRVAACNNCGFIFAFDIPSQEQYERYYNLNTRYIYNQGDIPDGLKKLHHDSFRLIEKFLKTNMSQIRYDTLKIIDIGCSTGNLLHIFKEHGYNNIFGLEPSQGCCLIANRRYGIRAIPQALSQYRTDDTYDLIIMSGVLEHIHDISDNLSRISALLKGNGFLFIMVPDVERFSTNPREPFHEFSLEHINFFTQTSLTNLLGKYRLTNKYSKSIEAPLYDSYALATIWGKTDLQMPIQKDMSGILKIKRYIKRSEEALKVLKEKIGELVRTQEEIAIWGVGSLTSRLLANTNLGKANIKVFVDRNKDLQGRKISGIEIASPDLLLDRDLTVFISSYVYRDEIKKMLKEELHYKGRIVLP